MPRQIATILPLILLVGGAAPAQTVQFEPKAVFEAAGSSPRNMQVADFDVQDGPDILLPCAGSDSDSGEVTILFNNGSGGFAEDSFTGIYKPWGSAVGDFDEDGCTDVVLATSGSGSTGVFPFRNNCSGAMSIWPGVTAGSFPIDVVTGRFDADDHIDFVVAANVSGGVKTFLGDGAGGFSLSSTLSASNCTALATADFNEDGRPDIVLGTYSNAAIKLNNGDGSFASGAGVGSGLMADVAVGDFNHDGHADAAAITHYTGVMSVVVGRGDGTFRSFASFSTGGGFVEGLAAADLDKDGYDDLVYTDLDGDYVRIYMNTRAGGFAAPITLGTDWQTRDVVVADFNGDGWPDIATGCANLGDVALVDVFLQIPPPACDADFNGDGGVNTLDVLAFLNAWSAGDPRGDFNDDGAINTLDVLAFLNAWSAGC